MVWTDKRIGILVGGGPAPGINSAISACVIAAADKGVDVIGIPDGFSRLMKGDIDRSFKLTSDDVEAVVFIVSTFFFSSSSSSCQGQTGFTARMSTSRSSDIESCFSLPVPPCCSSSS